MSKERLEEIGKELCEIQKLIKKGNQEDIKKINEKIIDLYCNNHVDFLFYQAKQELNLVKAHELKDLEHQGLVRQLKEKDEQNKRYRELLLKIFKVTQNHQIEKISDYAFSRAGMLFYEWLGASGAIDLDRYCDEVNGHDNYDEYNIERMIDEMIKARIKLEESE